MVSDYVTSRPEQCSADDRHPDDLVDDLVHAAAAEINSKAEEIYRSHAMDFNDSRDVAGYDSMHHGNTSDAVQTVWRIPGVDDEMFGYLLTVTTGISFFITVQVNEKYLLLNHNHVTITAWYGIIGTALSALVMLGLETPVLVHDTVCTWFTVLHCAFASCSMLLINYSLRYITAEENAILQTLSVVVLFVAQSTLLSRYQPSHGNMYEYIGAVLVVLACLLEPTYKLMFAATKEEAKEEPASKDKLVVDFVVKVEEPNEKTALLMTKYPTQQVSSYSAL